jgi:hypothetical protein
MRKTMETQVGHNSATNITIRDKMMSLKSLEINKVTLTYLTLPL